MEGHARARLRTGEVRTAPWRLKEIGLSLLNVTQAHVGLADHVEIDVHTSEDIAGRILRDEECAGAVTPESLLGDELLPDWYEDWVLIWREQHRQLRLHALEELASQRLRARNFARAFAAGLASFRKRSNLTKSADPGSGDEAVMRR